MALLGAPTALPCLLSFLGRFPLRPDGRDTPLKMAAEE